MNGFVSLRLLRSAKIDGKPDRGEAAPVDNGAYAARENRRQ